MAKSKTAQGLAVGPWSESEKHQFERACVLKGWGNWKAMARLVPSRSATQIKSHAQKVRRDRAQLLRDRHGEARASREEGRIKPEKKRRAASAKIKRRGPSARGKGSPNKRTPDGTATNETKNDRDDVIAYSSLSRAAIILSTTDISLLGTLSSNIPQGEVTPCSATHGEESIIDWNEPLAECPFEAGSEEAEFPSFSVDRDAASATSAHETTAADLMGKNCTDARYDREMYERIRSALAAGPDYNNRHEYVESERGRLRTALSAPALLRARLRRMLEVGPSSPCVFARKTFSI